MKAITPDRTVQCHATFDMSTSHNFVATRLAQLLNLHPIRERYVQVQHFGKRARKLKLYRIVLSGANGHAIEIEAFGVDHIASQVKSSKIPKQNLAYKPETSSIDIRIQLGSTVFWNALTSLPLAGPRPGMSSVRTTLGSIVLPGVQPRPPPLSSIKFVNFTQSKMCTINKPDQLTSAHSQTNTHTKRDAPALKSEHKEKSTSRRPQKATGMLKKRSTAKRALKQAKNTSKVAEKVEPKSASTHEGVDEKRALKAANHLPKAQCDVKLPLLLLLLLSLANSKPKDRSSAHSTARSLETSSLTLNECSTSPAPTNNS